LVAKERVAERFAQKFMGARRVGEVSAQTKGAERPAGVGRSGKKPVREVERKATRADQPDGRFFGVDGVCKIGGIEDGGVRDVFKMALEDAERAAGSVARAGEAAEDEDA